MARAAAEMGRGQMLKVCAWSLNQVGDKLRTQVKRQTAKQLGIPYSKTEASWKIDRANPGRLEYKITGTGKTYGLEQFGARQFSYGVRARPWGRAQKFAHAFMRKALVYVRTTAEQYPLHRMWGGSVPREMERDSVPYVAAQGMDKELPDVIDKKLTQFMPF